MPEDSIHAEILRDNIADAPHMAIGLVAFVHGPVTFSLSFSLSVRDQGIGG